MRRAAVKDNTSSSRARRLAGRVAAAAQRWASVAALKWATSCAACFGQGTDECAHLWPRHALAARIDHVQPAERQLSHQPGVHQHIDACRGAGGRFHAALYIAGNWRTSWRRATLKCDSMLHVPRATRSIAPVLAN